MPTVAVVGLGYVGLPLAVEFGKVYPTVGVDLHAEKVAAYCRFVDPTGEISTEELKAAVHPQAHHRCCSPERGRLCGGGCAHARR